MINTTLIALLSLSLCLISACSSSPPASDMYDTYDIHGTYIASDGTSWESKEAYDSAVAKEFNKQNAHYTCLKKALPNNEDGNAIRSLLVNRIIHIQRLTDYQKEMLHEYSLVCKSEVDIILANG